VKDKNFRNNK